MTGEKILMKDICLSDVQAQEIPGWQDIRIG
jgi:hypothetical protein